jgi:hypothetical protein
MGTEFSDSCEKAQNGEWVAVFSMLYLILLAALGLSWPVPLQSPQRAAVRRVRQSAKLQGSNHCIGQPDSCICCCIFSFRQLLLSGRVNVQR